ncbi:biotin transporter BioY [Halovenus marina]|uniref:biotin transporter BioY n=1 Tax=Halovenus marina TaxID=3396621 RepID=UPI003F55ED7F
MSSEYGEEVDLVSAETAAYVAGAAQLAALTGVLAWASIEISVVPFSFQPFGVFFAGLLLGPLWGGFAMGTYFLVGLAGVPVFSSGGAGIGYVTGPTGGFLVGFVFAAVVIGAISHRSLVPKSFDDLSVLWSGVALLAGLAVIYLVGVPWYAVVADLTLVEAGTAMGWFFVGDLIKIALTLSVVAGAVTLPTRLR